MKKIINSITNKLTLSQSALRPPSPTPAAKAMSIPA